METISYAPGAVRLPGHPVTAITLPRQRPAGFRANAYVARRVIAAALAVLATAGVASALMLTAFHKDMPAAHTEAGGKATTRTVGEPKRRPEASPIVAPIAVSGETELRAKADRLADLEKMAQKLELALAGSGEVQPAPSPVQRLEIKVTDGPRNGFWRSSGKDEQDFVIVEATDGSGMPAKAAVTDMDTGETRQVSRWAVRVSPAEFARLSAEKAVSGSIGGLLAGVRAEGAEGVDWKLDVEGGFLLDWQEAVQ